MNMYVDVVYRLYFFIFDWDKCKADHIKCSDFTISYAVELKPVWTVSSKSYSSIDETEILAELRQWHSPGCSSEVVSCEQSL